MPTPGAMVLEDLATGAHRHLGGGLACGGGTPGGGEPSAAAGPHLSKVKLLAQFGVVTI